MSIVLTRSFSGAAWA